MSDTSDKARLEAIIEYIDDIDRIVARHETIESALLDFEGEYALIMCIQQIGELVNKIESEKYTSFLPVKNIKGFHNIIAHQYDGINKQVAEMTIKKSIPELRNIIIELLEK